MAENSWDYLVRAWVEHRGKRRPPIPVNFQGDEVVARGTGIKVTEIAKAYYFNADPNVYIVLTTSDGNLQLTPGGYNPLEPGFYLRHYVDKRTRTSTLPEITETTLDGAKVSLTLTISYSVADPIKAMKLEHPVQTLFTLITSYTLQFIKDHTHDKIMGSENAKDEDRDAIAKSIGLQYNSHHNPVKIFAINEIVIERRGDPKLIGIRLEEKQRTAQIELSRNVQELQQQLDKKEEDFKKIKAHYDAEIRTIIARAENQIATQQLVLDNERNQKIWQQERVLQAVEAIQKAVVQVATPGFTPQPQITEVLLKLVNTLQQEIGAVTLPVESGEQPDTKPESETMPKAEPPRHPDSGKLDNLTQTLLTLLNRRKPGS